MDAQHGQLDQVGGRALDLHVDGFALGLVALLVGRIGADAGNLAPAAEQGGHVAGRAALLQQLGLVLQHARVAFEVGVDEGRRFFARDAQTLGQAKALMP